MSQLLEQDLRDAFADRAAQVDPHAIARLRAIDYHPRRRRRPPLPAIGALGLSGAGAAAGAIVLLGSSAPAAFAGWSPAPTAPSPGQLAAAQADCGSGPGVPVLTDTRGPYTAAIYDDGATVRTCLQGNGESMDSSSGGSNQATVPSGQVELAGSGMADSSGHAATLVDGRIGDGVQRVVIDRSDGTSVTATVAGGWYLAWWPGTAYATKAEVTTATGTSSEQFPAHPLGSTSSSCPAGSHCGVGYVFGSQGGASGSGTNRTGSISSRSASGRK